MTALTLGFGFRFDELYDDAALPRLDAVFLDQLRAADAGLADRLSAGRADPAALSKKDESLLLLAVAPHLEDFVGALFGVGDALDKTRAAHQALQNLYTVKRLFVQRRAAKALAPAAAAALTEDAVRAEVEPILGWPVDEQAFADKVAALTPDAATETANAAILQPLARYAAWALNAPAGRARHGAGVLFQQPKKLTFDSLVALKTTVGAEGCARFETAGHVKQRDGFNLTDQGMDLTQALDQANYCIWCAHQGKDSCSQGLKEKAPDAEGNPFKKSPFGVTLAGCPLDEKISELNQLKADAKPLAALAVACVDNPMLAGTGHRICNDCMKACVYQKQDPVDIPQIESRTLKDVLALPWGFEIYALLTRWNPLNLRTPWPKPSSGKTVLVAGLGPAGYTLAHWLMQDGHHVAAVDGLKIEPLPPELSGVAADGSRVPFQPIYAVEDIKEPLGDRKLWGFGGVAEYGITVRWDKNNLKLLRLIVERRARAALFSGVRFGGSLTAEDAFALGVDHVALCLGAGRPTVLDLPNGLAKGVRQASDFLMGLQLTGAGKADSLANLQLRLPVVVVGGGLTAIDTATEALAYYPLQVEKFLLRYEALVAEHGEPAVRARWSEEDAEVGAEFIAHAQAIRAERAAAAAEGRDADVVALLKSWGGATIAYRRRLIDSPSYTLNHEEVALGLEEGISFAELLTPKAVEVDRFGAATGLTCTRKDADGASSTLTLPARSVLVAAGTQPNTVLAREDGDTFKLDGKYFQAIDETGAPATPQRLSKPDAVRVLTHRRGDGRAISFFGDLHPSFAGNVVKAMGGAKRGYPVVTSVLAPQAAASTPAAVFAALAGGLRATVERVERLTPTILEVVVRAPFAAKNFKPGQFYRLQNFETQAPLVDAGSPLATRLAMEGLALTGAWTDEAQGLVSLIVLEMGGSSSLCAQLQPGQPVVLMGPTGAPTETPAGETALLVGGGLGNAVLFSIGRALRSVGSKVLYFAGYKKLEDRYKIDEIEAAADVIVWCCDEAPGFAPRRPQDRSFVGNIVEAMRAYGAGELGEQGLSLSDVDRVIAIGSDRMMQAVARSRYGVLKPYLKPKHHAIGSINSPMQCMMKEICAQCLQRHVDPETGKETVVFSCYNQDQELDHVDWNCLSDRLGQNAVQEKLTALWISRTVRRAAASI